MGAFFEWLDRKINPELYKPPALRDPEPDCKHLHTRVYSSSMIGRGQCLDCNKEVGLEVVFTNWILELERCKAGISSPPSSPSS